MILASTDGRFWNLGTMRFRTMVFGTFNGRHVMSRIELTPRGKKSETRSSASSVLLWFVSSALFGVFLPRVDLAGYLDFMMRGTCGPPA